MAILATSDLAPFATIDPAKAEAMIADAEAQAFIVAPCITDPDFLSDIALLAAARAVLRGAVLRWNEAGAAGKTTEQQSAGPLALTRTFDNTQQRRGMFWPSEIAQLQTLCARFSEEDPAGAYSVDTAPGANMNCHSPLCALGVGALYCSCGSDINNYEGPLYEGGPLS